MITPEKPLYLALLKLCPKPDTDYTFDGWSAHTDDDDRIKVYHSAGYCFDSFQYWDDESEQTEYGFCADYEGFEPLTVEEALELITFNPKK